MTLFPKSLKIFPVIALFCVSHYGFAQYTQDHETKKNIAPIDNSLAYVQQLEPVKFEYKTEKFPKLFLPNGPKYGFLTEDMQRVLPELVQTETRSYMAGKNQLKRTTLKETDLESLIPILVGAIKEQQEQIDELKRQLELLQPKP